MTDKTINISLPNKMIIMKLHASKLTDDWTKRTKGIIDRKLQFFSTPEHTPIAAGRRSDILERMRG